MKIVLASNNQGKLREILELLAPLGVEVVSAGALGLPEPDETEDSFEGNARIKALAAANASGLPALSDDSGFCVGALGGAPGVVSALWAGPGKDFAPAMARVRREMGDSADRRAWFVCVLCLAWRWAVDGWCQWNQQRSTSVRCDRSHADHHCRVSSAGDYRSSVDHQFVIGRR